MVVWVRSNCTDLPVNGGDAVPRSQPILRTGADGMAMPGLPLLFHRDGISEVEYHLLLAKDLKLIKPTDHAELSRRATELKRMLTALLQKLNADR